MTELVNSIGYSGTVTARLSTSNSKKHFLHNAGCKALWNLLAMTVTGHDVSNNGPHYFSVAKKLSSGKIEECLLADIPFVGRVWGDTVSIDDNCTCARFTVTVTKNDRRLKINESETAILQMFNRRGELLAQVFDNEDKAIARTHNSMITGVDAIYEWLMVFTNSPALLNYLKEE